MDIVETILTKLICKHEEEARRLDSYHRHLEETGRPFSTRLYWQGTLDGVKWSLAEIKYSRACHTAEGQAEFDLDERT